MQQTLMLGWVKLLCINQCFQIVRLWCVQLLSSTTGLSRHDTKFHRCNWVTAGGHPGHPSDQPIVATSGSIHQGMKTFTGFFELHQAALKPARGNHVLDPFITNQPNLICSTQVLSTTTDHDAVLCHMSAEHIKVKAGTKRKVYSYASADGAGINIVLNSYFTVFKTEAV